MLSPRTGSEEAQHLHYPRTSMKKVLNVPNDIVADILLRLPIEPVIRFKALCKSLCKSWCSLIHDPTFVELQLRKSKSEPRLILWDKDGCSINELILLDKQQRKNTLKVRKISLEYNGHDDVQKKIFDVHIIGSCNGLICKISAFPRRCCGVCHGISISNPITKECAVLPIRSGQTHTDSGIFGFGVDSTGKYKVIQIFKDGIWKGEIITLGESSWRELAEIPRHQLNHRSFEKIEVMIFMDGALYFIVQMASLNLRPIILMFDIHDEKFSIINFPSSIRPEYLYHLRLTVILDSLVIYQHRVSLGVCIWKIEIDKSKNNLRYQEFTVNLDKPWPNFYGCFSLVGMLNNNTFFFKLDNSKQLLVYCVEEKELSYIKLSETNLRLLQTGSSYFVPSLISPIVVACGKANDTRSELLGLNLQVVGYSSLSEFMNSSSYLSQPFIRVKSGFCRHCGGKARVPLGQVYQ